jgi:hypothetical protein
LLVAVSYVLALQADAVVALTTKKDVPGAVRPSTAVVC